MDNKQSFIKRNRTSILFILLMISFIILPITYSRYITRDTGFSETHLAKWEVNMIPNEENNLELIAYNETETNYNFTITSTSEVDCEYSLELSNIPTDVVLEISNDDTDYEDEISPDYSGKIKINKLGNFQANDVNSSHSYTLTFKSNDYTLSQDTEIGVNVVIRQIIG